MEFLLPNYPGLKLERTYIGQDRVLLLVNSTSKNAVCPDCSHPTQQIHSYYPRTLSDLAWADYTVRILLMARRFYCTNSACPKATFAERFGPAVEVYARRTKRCEAELSAIAHELGGAAGARLSASLGIKTSRDILLRIIQREELLSAPANPIAKCKEVEPVV